MTIFDRVEVVNSGVLAWEVLGDRLSVVSDQSTVHGLKCPSYPDGVRGELLASLDTEKGLLFDVPECEPNNQVRRYSGPCVTGRCQFWAGNCQLGAIVARAPSVAPLVFVPRDDSSDPARCPIGSVCRWRAENGESVCIGCQGVLYSGQPETGP